MKEGSLHTFKPTGDTKEDMICESSDLVYVVICSTCNKKYIEETREGKTWVLDKVRVR